LDNITPLWEDLVQFYETEMHEVRTCAELLEMKSVLDALRSCEDDVLESALAAYGNLTSHDVGAMVGADVGEAIARMTATRKKFHATAGSMRGLGGRVTGPPGLKFAIRPPPERKKRERQAGKKEKKTVVVPEQDKDPYTADNDPTSIAVKVC
jgi:hypothetical protein